MLYLYINSYQLQIYMNLEIRTPCSLIKNNLDALMSENDINTTPERPLLISQTISLLLQKLGCL